LVERRKAAAAARGVVVGVAVVGLLVGVVGGGVVRLPLSFNRGWTNVARASTGTRCVHMARP
jgi:hypothetical protein